MPLAEPELSAFEQAQNRARFRSRLATYFFGVAIGCVLLGLFWIQRQAAHKARTAPPPTPAAPTPR
jgi:uncharacterized membrane protein YciS (DUF1049 family)